MLKMVDIYFSYDGRPLINSLSLEVGEGERVAVMGRSGVGKTTLLKIASGLIKPHRGVVEVKARLSYIPQNLGLVETASALENVLFGSLDWRGFYIGIWRRDLKERALEALRVVGLEKLADVKVYKLSGGERQRVAIARALMQKSGLILADEPVASLDRETAESVLEILTSLNGVSVVAVMHDEDLARKFFQRGYLMKDGRLVRLW